MDTFVKTYRYMKGLYEVKVFDTGTRNLLYYDNKLNDSNFETTVNMGELTAGVGNPVVLNLPDSAKFNITLTAADIELRSRQLQTGGALGYNGITDTCELITATTTALTVTGTAVAPYGYASAVAYINGAGTAYSVNSSGVIQNFTATVGTQYSVKYYVAKAASEVLSIYSLFSPQVVTLEAKMPVFSAVSGASANTGSICGYWHIICPRYQFNGVASVSVNQTTAATSSLSGSALAYDDTTGTVCTNGAAILGYMVYEPVSATEGITDMVVLDGGVVTVGVGETVVLPVRYVMADGGLSIPDLSTLAYVSGAPSTASVAAGIVTGVASGSTEITITSTTPALTAVCNVTVTA